jgi:hypothetical protein
MNLGTQKYTNSTYQTIRFPSYFVDDTEGTISNDVQQFVFVEKKHSFS